MTNQTAENKMLNRFLQELETLAGQDYFRKRYLLAVSGGADSMVAASLFRDTGLDFAIAHCNFHLRGSDSDRDMHFVEKAAEKWQVPFFLREFDTSALQRNSGKSVEMVARELRYGWFNELLNSYDFLVTAHQATDAAETQLLNLCRGTGLKGLCGIPSINGKTIRPMLPFTAKEIRKYAEEHQIAYMEDDTNHDERIARNRIRHSVIPQLERLNPQFLATNGDTRRVLQRQFAYYQKNMEQEIARVVSEKGEQHLISRVQLTQCFDKELVLYEILSHFGFSADVIERLSADIPYQSGKQFFSDTHILLINRDFLILQAKKKEAEIPVAEIRSLEELRHYFEVEEFEYHKDMAFDKNPAVLYVPKEKLTFPLQIRSWCPGDFFYPLGGKGRQKLSDFFTDHKIDRFTKSQVRLLCAGDHILWIIGFRSDERWKVRDEATICYKVTLPRNPSPEGGLAAGMNAVELFRNQTSNDNG